MVVRITMIGSLLGMLLGAAPTGTWPVSKPLFAEDFEHCGDAGAVPEGWTFFTNTRTVSLSRERAHSGSFSLKLVDIDPKRAVGLRSPRIPAVAERIYVVEWWYWGEERNNQSLYLEFWNKAGHRISGTSFGCSGKGRWVHGRNRVAAPAGTVSLTVHVNSFSTNRATGWFDDIVVYASSLKNTLKRKPYPPAAVRHPCGLYRQEDVERARRNIEKHAWAREVLNSLRRSAAFWHDVPEDKLTYWIPDLTPFRVVDCPACGAGWRFAWGGSSEKLVCRKCGFTWPNPDYPESASQTFIDPLGMPQVIPYYRGKPSTEYGAAKTDVYRLSGYLRHRRVGRLSGLGAAGKVYALTGDVSYAATVRRVLLRLARVYPHYLPHDWNHVYRDYSNLQSGKLSGWKLADAGIFIQLATAYDLTYNSGVYSDADKVLIEEGCFREFARLMTATSPRGCCINDGPTAMGAGALAGLMLGDHNTIAWAIEPPDGFLGFIEQYFVRDGHWYEASPSYEAMSIQPLYVTPEALRGYSDPPSVKPPERYDNLDLLAHPLMKKILLASAHCVMPDGNLPPTNDSTWGAHYSWHWAEKNAFWYPTSKNRRILAWAMGGKASSTGDEYALFRRDPDFDPGKLDPLSPAADSQIQPGVGWAMLRSGDTSSDVALFLDFGPKGSGHGHPDRLNIIYYDYATELVTDLGYLGWGHPNHPWLRCTASHNEVIVDGQPQGAAGGEVELFSGRGGPVQGVIASAPACYAKRVTAYRRHMVLVNHGVGQRYLVDLFEVTGGKDHQYAFHGGGETIQVPKADYRPVQAEALGDKATGYPLLHNIRAAAIDGDFAVAWLTDPARGFGVRLHMLGQSGTELVVADANGLRNRSTPFATVAMHPIYVRRRGPKHRFLAVVEGVKGMGEAQEPGAAAAFPASRLVPRRLTAVSAKGWCDALEVTRGENHDIIVFASPEAAESGVSVREYPLLHVGSRLATVGLRGSKPTVLWAAGGTGVSWEQTSLTTISPFRGTITDIDRENFVLRVRTSAEAPSDPALLRGGYCFAEGLSDGAYRVKDVRLTEGNELRVALADEPIIRLDKGRTVSFVPSARLQLDSSRKTAVIGGFQSACWRTPVGGARFVREGSGRWQRRDTVAAGALLRLRAEETSDPDTRVVIAPGDLEGDRKPPRILAVNTPDGKALSLPEAGYVSALHRVVITLSDDSPLYPEDIDVSLTGTVAGSIPVSSSLDKAGADRPRLDCRWGDLPEDDYTLRIVVRDLAFHVTEATLHFTTAGWTIPFRDMKVAGSNGKVVKFFSGLDTRFYRSAKPGDWIEFEFDLPEKGRYAASLCFTRYSAYGIIDVAIDGKTLARGIDLYGKTLQPGAGRADLGSVVCAAGKHRVKLTVTGKNDAADHAFIGVRSLIFKPLP